MTEVEKLRLVEIDYTNYRGVREKRIVLPLVIEFMSSEWHPKPQWCLRAYCTQREAVRTFAMESIHSWGFAP